MGIGLTVLDKQILCQLWGRFGRSCIGGSINTALHLPAITYEADCEISMGLFEELCRTTPHVAKMNPAAPPNVPDFHHAGGVSAEKGAIIRHKFG